MGSAEIGQVNPGRNEDEEDFQAFLTARKFWLTLSPEQYNLSPSAQGPQVFAVIMDWRIKNKQVMVAAAEDGTSSLYISPGSKILGGYSAKNEAMAVVAAAERLLPLANQVRDHPLPPAGEIRFYIRTPKGVLMIGDQESDLMQEKGRTVELFVATNKLMSALFRMIDQ